MSGVNEWLISLSEYIGGMSDELDNAKAENAALRELVRDIRICARDNQCSLCYLASGKCDFSDRMCELGVEVDV